MRRMVPEVKVFTLGAKLARGGVFSLPLAARRRAPDDLGLLGTPLQRSRNDRRRVVPGMMVKLSCPFRVGEDPVAILPGATREEFHYETFEDRITTTATEPEELALALLDKVSAAHPVALYRRAAHLPAFAIGAKVVCFGGWVSR